MMPISSITLLMQSFENADEGTDTVYSTAHFRLSENVENLILQGSADLQGYGNGLANAIFGSSGNDLLDGGAGADCDERRAKAMTPIS